MPGQICMSPSWTITVSSIYQFAEKATQKSVVLLTKEEEHNGAVKYRLASRVRIVTR